MEPLRTPPPRGHQGPGADAHPPTNAPPTHTILTQNWAWETPTLNTRLLVVPNGPRPRAAPLDKLQMGLGGALRLTKGVDCTNAGVPWQSCALV
eukprot:CAMPEP_0174381500 /NCGR_PEP_ID=MMETSP0811_2-20130205/124055_1 /TAXON_ID=73025 ORGANISM="Eutreptiella gymnastica-like, Strain CCMP1594" /NCGR_SAMPLE_ID=MMETSP0811_2 /ASSEMBLY_ACC=CAM_ASM_000667 /LENGTH=93 /DNA_ID=CAMNT_0015534665 /DNA_START=1550 /DNA_END=1832 /DNA_ORIENTATION=+